MRTTTPVHPAPRLLSLVLGLLLAGCSGSSGGESAADPGPALSDAGVASDPGKTVPTGDTGALPVSVEKSVRRPLYKNAKFYLEEYRPATCQAAAPCPALVLVPPGLDAGETYFAGVAEGLAAEMPAVVVVYNPPGRGVGSNRTAGEEDYNGRAHRGLLSEVLKQVRLWAEVDPERIGLISFGWGLAPAAGAVTSEQGPAAFFAKFLIDVEGPVTRCDITAAPFSGVEPVVNGDGPGVTPSRCGLCGGSCDAGSVPGFCDCAPAAAAGDPRCGRTAMPRDCKYPSGTESQQPPTAYVCNENATPIRQSGKPCDADPWWREREPAQVLPRIVVAYQRLQFRFDHRAPSPHAGREAYQLVLTGTSGPFRRYNNLPPNEALPDVSSCGVSCELDCAADQLPCGSANGLEGNPFAAFHPDYRPMDLALFMRKVLPVFVRDLLGR